MAAIYDPQGNIIGDDGGPTLDQMNLELSKQNRLTPQQMEKFVAPQSLASQIPGYGKPVPPSQTPPDPLGSAAGNFTELATKFNPLMMAKSMREAAGIITVPAVAAVKGVGESLTTSPAGTFTSGKAPAYAEKVATQFMQQNAPQTPMAQEFTSAIAPYMADLPAYLGHLQTGRPAFTPNDLRVMGAEATRVGRQVKDIPTDFYNAQSGLQKLDPITGQPTYGAKLQGVAESVGDFTAARRAEGKSLIPGIPDVVTPETSLYAVRPQGSRLAKPTVPKGANLSRTWDKDVLDEVNLDPMSPGRAWDVIDSTVLAVGPQRTAFRKFMEEKYKEMYPDAPSITEAKDAFQTMYNDRDTRSAKILEFYDEFLQAPEGAVVGANNLLTATEIKDRHEAASQWLNNNLLNYIQKNVGTEGDPLVKAASEGLTFFPPDQYDNASQSSGGKNLVEQNRRAGNMPIEGSFAEPIAKKETELAEAQSKLNEIEAKRRNLSDIAMKQGLPDPAMLPEYAALTNPVRNAVRERDRIEEQLDNLKVGRKYEAAVDYGVAPMTAEDFLGTRMEYSERQFYPTILKTPPQENVYRTYGSHLDSLGFSRLAHAFYSDVMSGDIPLDKVGKMTVENYVRKTAKTRVEEERLAKAAAKAFKTNAEATLQQRAAAIPNDKTFGNAGMIELTKDTPEYDIIRTMSEDTAVLDHCVGQGGSARGSDDKNPWYGNSSRSYEPILDLVTGQPNPRATSDRTTYVRQVQNGDKIISVRDLATGLPQATLHFEQSRIGNSGQQKYSIGYASGHQNGDIDAKYSGAIRDYLNSIADDIDSSGYNLQSHAGVFDMFDADFASAMRKQLNMSRQDLEKYDLENMLPRFVTVSDVRAAVKAANLANAEPAKAELIELNAAIEDAMQEHADLMRMARRRPMDEDDRTHVAELEANINTMRQRIRDLEQLTPAVVPAPATNMTYRTPSLVEANTIIGSLDDVGNSQMIDLRNDVSERAREQFMNTYAELARENGLTTVTVDNIADFGRALSGLRDDIGMQRASLSNTGFEGRAVAEALENVSDVLSRHINNLATGPEDDFAAQADALMADPDLFANAPAPRINNQDEVAQTIRDMAAQRTESLRQIDPDLGNVMDTIVTDTAAFYSPTTAPRSFANAIRGAGVTAGTEALRNSLTALANTVDAIVDLAEQAPAQLPAAQVAPPFDWVGAVNNASSSLTANFGAVIADRFDTIAHRVAENYNPRLDPSGYADALRAVDPALEHGAIITELEGLANRIELHTQPPAARGPEEFDPEVFTGNYINDARRTTPDEDIVRVTRIIDDIAVHLNMRDNTAEFVTQLRRAGDLAQSEITELTLYDLADQLETRMAEQLQDLATTRRDQISTLLADQEVDPDELRRVANQLQSPDDNMPIEYWMALDDATRRAFAQELRRRANYMEFNPNVFAQRLATEAGLNILELRDTVQALNDGNFDHEVLLGLPTTERGRSEQRTALELERLVNQIQNGEANIPQQIAQREPVRDTVRNADIQVLFDALTAPERARVSAAVDQAVLSNNSFEGEEGISTARRLAQLIREYPIGLVENMMQVERELVARGIDAIADARELGIGNPPPEGNANGGPVRGYQKGGTVKKPDVPTPYLFSVPTYSETVAYEMYPGQLGQNDQRDAARHMLAAGTLSRKYGPKTAEFLGKAHEFTTSPLQAVKSMFTGKMPVDYDMDTHNNRFGAELGQRAKSQAELEDLVQAEAERASRTQTPDKAFIKKANGGIVQENPTTDQMRYALTMRRK